MFGLDEFPGRCPGLTNGAPSGLGYSRAWADTDKVVRVEVWRVVGGVAGIAALVASRVGGLAASPSSDADSPRRAGTPNSSWHCASASLRSFAAHASRVRVHASPSFLSTFSSSRLTVSISSSASRSSTTASSSGSTSACSPTET